MRGALTSSETAAVVSYVRGAWGNRATPVSEQDVRRLRAAIRRQTGRARLHPMRAASGGIVSLTSSGSDYPRSTATALISTI